MELTVVDDARRHLQHVIDLAKDNRKTLGFLPDQVFADAAAGGTLLVAVRGDGTCVGYLLYRVIKRRGVVSITHLCVASGWRKEGVARRLIEGLSEKTRDYHGIKALCRRDYGLQDLWGRLLFVAIGDQPGRGRDGEQLTIWWRSQGHPTIFDVVDQDDVDMKLKAVIDANVFLDLDDVGGREESKALNADWLRDSLELYVTEEMRNEVNRIPGASERNRQRTLIDTFPFIHDPGSALSGIVETIRPFFPDVMSSSDESDLRHLARAIAAGMPFFVTRDQPILDKHDPILERFGTTIIRPSDLIIRLDELRRQVEYQPARLAGTLMGIRRVRGNEQRLLWEHFRFQGAHSETKAEFYSRLRTFLSHPDRYSSLVAFDVDDAPLAFIVYDRTTDKLGIPLLRVKDTRLGATLARHMVLRALLLSSREHRSLTAVTDPYLRVTTLSALQENGFFQHGDAWVKVGLAVAEGAHILSQRLHALAETTGLERVREMAMTLDTTGATQDVRAMVDVERVLWPAKVIDADIPTFIVPIRPRWAQHLFDEKLAAETLLGADPSRVLNSESVYYRAAKPSLTSPARILWYVSQDNRYGWAKNLRACSFLDDIVIDTPTALFKQFERLGVYEWPHVRETAKGDVDKEIMAIRFSGTELFPHPVPWDEVQRVLAEEGGRSPLAGPLRITNRAFSRLYARGNREEGGADVA